MMKVMYRDGLYKNAEMHEHCILPRYVTGVDANSFHDRDNLHTIELHDGVNYIGDFSFKLCYNLRKLILPRQVDYFGIGAFQQCNKLKKISLPVGTTRIDPGMFVCCESLSRIEIPHTVETIDPYAFSRCTELREIMIAPESFSYLPITVKRIAALTYFNELSGEVDEAMASFGRENSYEIARRAITEDRVRALDYMVRNEMILRRDVPRLLEEAGRLGKTELSAMLIGAGGAGAAVDDLFEWDPFA